MSVIKKKLLLISSMSAFVLSQVYFLQASFFSGLENDPIYCQKDGDCGLEAGVKLVEKTVNGEIKTGTTFSAYIQEIIIYLLGFLTLIAVIYIIYAGFRILVSNGEEDVIKKSKSTILYVIIGIIVIWLAWTIANFAIQVANGGKPVVVTATT